jgi:hypothetical protein
LVTIAEKKVEIKRRMKIEKIEMKEAGKISKRKVPQCEFLFV